MSDYTEIVHKTKVSEYGLKHGRLDYKALSELIGPIIFNGIVRDRTMSDWEVYAGEFYKMILADYIITPYGAKFLKAFTDELVFYNRNLDIYVWATTHWGDDWSQELSNLKLEDLKKIGETTL